MSTFRYRALSDGVAVGGCLEATDPAAARVMLRARGLTILKIRTARASGPLLEPLREAMNGHLRRRRVPARADLFEDLASLIETGVPLAEAVASLASSDDAKRGARRYLLRELGDALRVGTSFSAVARSLPAWFDGADTAMLEAGEHAGSLADALRSLGARHARSGELTRRVTAALAYPLVVSGVGIGVVVFLGQVTLPRLAGLLSEAGVSVPALTALVIRAGRVFTTGWPLIVAAVACGVVAAAVVRSAITSGRLQVPDRLRRVVPRAARRAALAGALRELALVLRCGVPLVEALRVVAPTARGLGVAGLRLRLSQAALRIERGEDLSDALDDPQWFSAATRRALQVGETAGQLAEQLDRVADAEARRAKSLADRLAAMLEPAAVLTLAAMIGLVVLAAVQPLVKLQEVIR